MASLKKRGNKYYRQYYIGGVQHRKSLGTSSLQVAKERKRQFESAMLWQEGIPLPTKTSLAAIVEQYTNHIQLRFLTPSRPHTMPSTAKYLQ